MKEGPGLGCALGLPIHSSGLGGSTVQVGEQGPT